MYKTTFCLAFFIAATLSSCSYSSEALLGNETLPATVMITPPPVVQNWLEYENADFSIAYPESWKPARTFDYDPQVPTRVWVFSGKTNKEQNTIPAVNIGVRSGEIETNESLMQWSIHQALHSQATSEFEDLEVSVEKEGEVGGLEAVFATGRSSLTEFQYVNIRCNDLVWFIWSTIGKTSSIDLQQTYNKMIDSFKLNCKNEQQ